MSASGQVALLRGINVGGRAKVKMDALRAVFASIGIDDAQTYLQSGNVVFAADGDGRKLAATIEAGIGEQLEIQVPVLVRSGAELAKAIDRNPFVKDVKDTASLYITFLAAKPDPAGVKRILAEAGPPDRIAVLGLEAHLDIPAGYGRTKLNNAQFERRLGVVATTRNWRTVTTLAEMAAQIESRLS